jgi:hypothetical protein
MSCTITPGIDPSVKIQIMASNEAMNRYRHDFYGMNVCKVGYDYSYLADMRFLLEYSSCAETVCNCLCDCSSTKIKERINTL